ncbi:MAG: calcium-dependent protein kinase 21 [Pseudomarimonas sp.]
MATAVVLGLSVLLPFAAIAQNTPADYLRRIDINADARLDLHEFQSYMSAGFDAKDHNRNAVLDLDEQPAGARRRPLSRVTHLRAIEAGFRRQDRNGDGYLSASELSAPPG